MLLVGGDEAAAVAIAADEIRALSEPQPALQNGVYLYLRPGNSAVVMAVRQAQRAGEACTVDLLADFSHPVARTYMWFESLWGNAAASQAAPTFKVGDVCVYAGDASKIVRVLEVTRSGGANYYRCQHLDGTSGAATVAEAGLKPVTPPPISLRLGCNKRRSVPPSLRLVSRRRRFATR
ncbi:MAG: hypothetical protein R2689_01645 [Microthrixaceae bacterium]